MTSTSSEWRICFDYARPFNKREPVFCLDEKPVCLHDEKRPSLIARNGSRRRDYEYRRRGTANLFVGVEPKGVDSFGQIEPDALWAAVLPFLREVVG